MHDRAGRLTEYCRGRAGAGLRAVVTYGDDPADLVYLRADLADGGAPTWLAALADRATAVHVDLVATGASRDRPRATVHAVDGGIVLQVLLGHDGGIAAVFEPSAGRHPLDFVDGCLARVAPDGPIDGTRPIPVAA